MSAEAELVKLNNTLTRIQSELDGATRYIKVLESRTRDQQEEIYQLQDDLAQHEKQAKELRDAYHPVARECRGLHTLGQHLVRNGAAVGTWTNFMGLHPLDVYPSARLIHFEHPNIQTYSWSEPVPPDNNALYKLIFDITEVRQVYGKGIPLLDGPGAIAECYDPDPPDPKWKRNGMMQMLFLNRTSVFEPHWEAQNYTLAAALQRWWSRLDRLIGFLAKIDSMDFLACDED